MCHVRIPYISVMNAFMIFIIVSNVNTVWANISVVIFFLLPYDARQVFNPLEMLWHLVQMFLPQG